MPLWHKFLQGYYDRSGISTDHFSQVVLFTPQGKAQLTPEFKKRGLQLHTSVMPSIFYIGFNQLDPIVGGHSLRKKSLRQAISIAIDYEEYIRLFLNGRGVVAHGPIPIGISGAQHLPVGLNTYVYNAQGNRKSIAEARELMRIAGYPNGLDPKTNAPLILHYDLPASAGPETGAQLAWMRKQFNKLGIRLDIRNTQYNRFQDKVATGQVQLFFFGWSADYPDPENFLFLFYGPNGRVKHHGENTSNYDNPKYNKLFEKMRHLSPGPKRQKIIAKMITILQQDSPWVWGFYPKVFALHHSWIQSLPPNAMVQNGLKYLHLNTAQRIKYQHQLNKVHLWPIYGLLILVISLIVSLLLYIYRRNLDPANQRQD